MATFAKYVKDKEIDSDRIIEQTEKLGGKSGYVVMFVWDIGREFPLCTDPNNRWEAFVASVPK